MLIVDDQSAIRELIGIFLERGGYSVLEAGSKSEALQLWSQKKDEILAVVSDKILSANDSGKEMLSEMVKEKASLATILISGDPIDSLSGSNITEGVDYFVKPFNPADLTQAVDLLLGNDQALSN
ncbi:MAG: two component transcriptional regulator, winged helix family [Verrucomicrobiales bacterium]|nr:two component transcriptional regulator, winged helix family [Verrucomicrobiales bacterium]